MKRLFYLSGTMFFLSLTLLAGLQIVQRTATAAPNMPKVVGHDWDGTPGSIGLWVILENGDVYHQTSGQPATFFRSVWDSY